MEEGAYMRPELEEAKKDILATVGSLPPSAPRFEPHFVRNRNVMLRFLEGQSIDNIAIDLGLDPKQVKQILKRQPVRQEVQRLAGLANDRYVQERVDNLSIEALDLVRDTMRGTNFSEMRFKAAQEVLKLNPLLKAAERNEASKAMAEGLGEAIITRLAQLESEKARQKEEIDVTPEPKESAAE